MSPLLRPKMRVIHFLKIKFRLYVYMSRTHCSRMQDWVIVSPQSMNGNPLQRTVSQKLVKPSTAAAAASRKMEEDDTPPPEPTRFSGALGVESRKNSVVLPPLRPGLAKVAGDSKDSKAKSDPGSTVAKPTAVDSTGIFYQPDGTLGCNGDAKSIVTLELLKTRFHSEPTLKEKHYYGYQTQTIVTSSEVGNLFNTVAVGTGYHQRLGSSIKMLRLHVRGCFFWTAEDGFSPADTLMLQLPRAYFLIKRVKIPYTPGTPASGWTTGANPPSGDLNLFSCLGNTVTNWGSIDISQRNPMAHIQTDILRLHSFIPCKSTNGGPTMQLANNTSIGYVYPSMEPFEFDIDLHGWTADYPSTGQPTYPYTNAIEYSFISNVPNTANPGYKIMLLHTWDLVFKDGNEN